jgi:hypothetical protein
MTECFHFSSPMQLTEFSASNTYHANEKTFLDWTPDSPYGPVSPTPPRAAVCCPDGVAIINNNKNHVLLEDDLGIDARIILKWTLKKWDVRVLSHFKWLRIQWIVDFCEDDSEHSSSINGGFLDQVSNKQLLHYLVVVEVVTWMMTEGSSKTLLTTVQAVSLVSAPCSCSNNTWQMRSLASQLFLLLLLPPFVSNVTATRNITLQYFQTETTLTALTASAVQS